MSSQQRPNMRETIYRTHLEEYAERWQDFLALRREDGILEVRFHSDGGPFLWGVEVHKNLIPALHDIASDPENECLIVTGTGDAFLAGSDDASWIRNGQFLDAPNFTADQTYDHWYVTQTRLPFSLFHLPIPIVSAINGPHRVHAELSVCADLVICADNTYFQDVHVFEGMVPGDGSHIVWRELLGLNRGRAFLLTGDKIEAQEALDLGIVYEVLPPEQLNDRAWELAREVFMRQPRLTRRMTHSLLMQPWREAWEKEIWTGLAHEAVAGREARISRRFGVPAEAAAANETG